jgi:hypothetical protein
MLFILPRVTGRVLKHESGESHQAYILSVHNLLSVKRLALSGTSGHADRQLRRLRKVITKKCCLQPPRLR